MNGSPTGSPGDPPDPPDPPSTEDEPDAPVRINFTKAPLVVLGGVMGVLLAVLTAQVLLTEGDGSTVVTQPVGRTQEPTPDARSANVDGNENEPAGAPDPTPSTGDADTASSGDEDATSPPEPGDASAQDPSAEGTVSRSIDRMNDPAYVTDKIAEGFALDFRGVIDESDARCMAEVVIRMFGIDRLWEITHAMADANVDHGSFDREDPRLLSDAEADELNTRLRTCVSEEAAQRLNLN